MIMTLVNSVMSWDCIFIKDNDFHSVTPGSDDNPIVPRCNA